MTNKILIGSQYFFNCYQDFHSKDVDYLEIIDTFEFTQLRQISSLGKCLFQLKRHLNKEPYIRWALQSKTPMCVGKFLVPEFNAQIGFTIEDLPRMQPLIDKLDDKHKYEEIIYNSYLENGDFILTEQQRLQAYESYKSSRNI